MQMLATHEQNAGCHAGTITWNVGRKTRRFRVIDYPTPHIVVSSTKQLHGWWPGKRECTGERMLINPYNGCEFSCLYCYANRMDWGYFRLFRQRRVVTVFGDMDLNVKRQLDAIDFASTGYLSPVTDPFQPVEDRYRLSQKIVEAFTERGVPIEVVTKGIVPDTVIRQLAQNPHSFAQVSITTVNESIRKQLSPGHGATTDELFYNLRRISSWPSEYRDKIHTVCRIDPILPFITDDRQELKQLIRRAKLCGADHIIASCVDLSVTSAKQMFNLFYSINENPKTPYEELFTERMNGTLHANIEYRRELFSFLRNLCIENELSFALCMEFEKCNDMSSVKTASGKMKKVSSRGLNAEFMAGCKNCEGIDIPVYVRDFSGGSGEYTDISGTRRPRFMPAASCDGACLSCRDSACGVSELAMGANADSRKDFTLCDYRRWSRELAGKKQEELTLTPVT